MLIYEKKGRIWKEEYMFGVKVIEDLYNYKIEYKIGEIWFMYVGIDVVN